MQLVISVSLTICLISIEFSLRVETVIAMQLVISASLISD